MQKILFVCLGNICRSPLAEGIFEKMIQEAGVANQFQVDSAGTASYHVGERPHRGAQRIAQAYGVSLNGQRSRQIMVADFARFDWLICMDRSNVNDLSQMNPNVQSKIRLLLDFADTNEDSVHDPYYDGDFERTYRQVESGCRGLLDFVQNHRLQNES